MKAKEIIAGCDSYKPYRLRTPEEQMSREEMLQQLSELRSIYLGTRRSMALGLAIKMLTEKNSKDGNL